jgi:hypothetical protein
MYIIHDGKLCVKYFAKFFEVFFGGGKEGFCGVLGREGGGKRELQ